MPAFLSALERLAEARPEDAEVFLQLGEYRALHFADAGAREAFLKARDLAEDAAVGAQACLRLADMAERAGRSEEAVAHLRAAVKLADDPQAYARLGALLLAGDPAEGVQALTRATVLAPDDPARALAAAAAAARLAEKRPDLSDAIASELQLLLEE